MLAGIPVPEGKAMGRRSPSPRAASRVRRAVLGNCVPRTLLPHRELPGAATVGDSGWAAVGDGPWLDHFAAVCDVFIPVGRNLPYQQRLDTRPFATAVMTARTNRVADLLSSVGSIRDAVAQVRPGMVLRIAH
jgi:hypothetical protein